MNSSPKEMPILEHIRELRNILLTSLIAFAVACIVAFTCANQIINFFILPLSSIDSLLDTTMVVSSIVEGFVAKLRISLIAGFILSLPVHIFGILRFAFPALTGREKRIVMCFLVFSLILIVIGAYLVYFRLVPLAISFLTNPYFVPQTVGFLLNYQTNVFYLLTFILWAVLALQLPLVMEILLVMNILKRRQVWKATRFIIVGFFILAAIVTPPDVISQIGVAVPLITFHFLALLIAKIFKFGEG
jgi:sec-independent protein translocase protein TatC